MPPTRRSVLCVRCRAALPSLTHPVPQVICRMTITRMMTTSTPMMVPMIPRFMNLSPRSTIRCHLRGTRASRPQTSCSGDGQRRSATVWPALRQAVLAYRSGGTVFRHRSVQRSDQPIGVRAAWVSAPTGQPHHRDSCLPSRPTGYLVLARGHQSCTAARSRRSSR